MVKVKNKIIISDVTLRDGNHAVNHSINEKVIEKSKYLARFESERPMISYSGINKVSTNRKQL